LAVGRSRGVAEASPVTTLSNRALQKLEIVSLDDVSDGPFGGDVERPGRALCSVCGEMRADAAGRHSE
jgi:hypothetical protein